jgi:hypothetical protein
MSTTSSGPTFFSTCSQPVHITASCMRLCDGKLQGALWHALQTEIQAYPDLGDRRVPREKKRTSMSWLQARRMLGNSAFMLDVLKAVATAFLHSAGILCQRSDQADNVH